MNTIVYFGMYFLMRLLAFFPLDWLYLLSDLLFYPLYYLIRYRRRLTRRNLLNAFPEADLKSVVSIEKQFYRHFCDCFFETVKLLHISDEEMKRRFVFNNIKLLEDRMQNGNSCLMLLGHYGNWEWVTSITLWSSDTETRFAQVYRPLKNKASNRFFLKLRTRFHSVGFEKNAVLREIVKMRKEGVKSMIGFISDQKPSGNNMHYWTQFLNQETSVLTGVERIARQTGFLVAYLDVRKVKRGYYEADIQLVTDDPKSVAEYEITEQYIRALEQTILRQPAYWLWTHNRWKYQKTVK